MLNSEWKDNQVAYFIEYVRVEGKENLERSHWEQKPFVMKVS